MSLRESRIGIYEEPKKQNWLGGRLQVGQSLLNPQLGGGQNGK